MNLISNICYCVKYAKDMKITATCILYVSKVIHQVYDSLPPHSAWNQQSPLSRKLAKEGRLVAIIRSSFNIRFPVIDA